MGRRELSIPLYFGTVGSIISIEILARWVKNIDLVRIDF